MTPNQLVAYNLRRARLMRDWTQEETVIKLEPHLGERWTVVNYSSAERSVTGKRIRQFDADEIVAFARAFDVPVNWFFVERRGADGGAEDEKHYFAQTLREVADLLDSGTIP